MKLLQRFPLKNKAICTLYVLTEAQQAEVVQLQNQVVDHLQDKSILQALTHEEWQYIFSDKGLIIGAFVDEQCVAIRAVLQPPLADEYMGEHCYVTPEQRPYIMYQEISFVHPKMTGNGLQQKLAQTIMQEMDTTVVKYVTTTVAATNIPSLLDKFRQQMVATAYEEIYEGKMRFVLVKRTDNAPLLTLGETEVMPFTDIAIVQQRLRTAWCITGIEQIDTTWHYRLRKITAINLQ